MTAPRSCRACGAELTGDVMWCLRCYQPVQQLTPRAEPLPPLPPDELIDPRSVRPEFGALRPGRVATSRVIGGPTSFGLLGRLAVTAAVVLFVPWAGGVGPLGFVYLIGFAPIAFVVLRSTWGRTPIEADRVFVLPSGATRSAVRWGSAGLGLAVEVVVVAAGGPWIAALPAAVLLLTAVGPVWRAVELGLAEVLERPLGLLVALNALNVIDVVASDAAIRAGQANELNPLVGRAGTPGKIALVLACSLLLYRVRPKALIWPTVAFVVLAVYHLTGWLLMA